MIRLTKGERPAILEDRADEWTQEYVDLLEAGDGVPDAVRYRYRHPDIKQALRAESSDKCIYCESKMSHIFPGDTDHLAPVSRRPDLYVRWENLGYVCRECNQAKGAYYNAAEPLMDPFADEPEEHLAFFGPLVFHRPGDEMGLRTIGRLKLRRSSLVERRAELLGKLQVMIDRWARVAEGPTREFLREEIVELAGESREYAATARAFLSQACGW